MPPQNHKKNEETEKTSKKKAPREKRLRDDAAASSAVDAADDASASLLPDGGRLLRGSSFIENHDPMPRTTAALRQKALLYSAAGAARLQALHQEHLRKTAQRQAARRHIRDPDTAAAKATTTATVSASVSSPPPPTSSVMLQREASTIAGRRHNRSLSSTAITTTATSSHRHRHAKRGPAQKPSTGGASGGEQSDFVEGLSSLSPLQRRGSYIDGAAASVQRAVDRAQALLALQPSSLAASAASIIGSQSGSMTTTSRSGGGASSSTVLMGTPTRDSLTAGGSNSAATFGKNAGDDDDEDNFSPAPRPTKSGSGGGGGSAADRTMSKKQLLALRRAPTMNVRGSFLLPPRTYPSAGGLSNDDSNDGGANSSALTPRTHADNSNSSTSYGNSNSNSSSTGASNSDANKKAAKLCAAALQAFPQSVVGVVPYVEGSVADTDSRPPSPNALVLDEYRFPVSPTDDLLQKKKSDDSVKEGASKKGGQGMDDHDAEEEQGSGGRLTTILPPPSPPLAGGSSAVPVAPLPLPKLYTIVLDLDETVIYARDGPLYARANLRELLLCMHLYAEVVVWTAAERDYAKAILEEINADHVIQHMIYRHRKWFDEDDYTKDLRLLGRDLRYTLIIENTPDCVRVNPDNGIIVSDFEVAPPPSSGSSSSASSDDEAADVDASTATAEPPQQDHTFKKLIRFVTDLGSSGGVEVPTFLRSHPLLRQQTVIGSNGDEIPIWYLSSRRAKKRQLDLVATAGNATSTATATRDEGTRKKGCGSGGKVVKRNRDLRKNKNDDNA